jgi:hypothetical protein
VRNRHKKAKRAQRKTDLLLGQQEFGFEVDWHEVIEHPLAHSPKKERNRNKDKISIQISSL